MKKTTFTFFTKTPFILQLWLLAGLLVLANPLFGQRIFFSSNTSGEIGVLDNGSMQTFASQGMDADGIFYDADRDLLFQINRTDDVVNLYGGVNDAIMNGTAPTLLSTSTSNFSNGREIAVYANKVVVADDASADNNSTNSLVVYTLNGDNSLTYDKKHEVNFALWGIHLEGSTLYAIQDVSPNVSVFTDFFNNSDGSISPSQTVFIQDLVRTHGLTYDSESDLMILTDIGAASSPDDGFLIVVEDFSTKLGDNAIGTSEQIRVGGMSSMLGNPVDVAYDADNGKIYVAERAKNGGMILRFDVPTSSGDVTPDFTMDFAGASAVNIPMMNSGACASVDGGLVELAAGGTTTMIFIDGQPDMIEFSSSVPSSPDYEFTYVVTDDMGNILGIPGGNMVDFDPAGIGSCLVYGLAYTGNLNIAMGDDLLAAGLAISTDCFDLSSNNLTVNRIASQVPNTRLVFSSNTTGTIGVLDNGMMGMFASQGMDADGIFYDSNKDVLYQINRTDDVVNVYTNVNDAIANGTEPTLVATSTSDFANGRELAVFANKLVVADDASADNNSTNSLVVYTINADNSLTYEKKHEVNFALWGIHLEGSTLYAIQDVSPNVSVFNDFFSNPDGIVSPDQTVYIQNLVRTHGLTYDSENDLMILTDIGAASSADDGYLVVITDFSTKINDNAIGTSEQIRVGGASSMLGNPVDVAYDAANEKIYVAERANGGGMILGFAMPMASGNVSPEYIKEFAGASAIHLPAPADGDCVGISGGLVSLALGGTATTIFIDGQPDMIAFNSTVPASADYSFTYVVTDAMGNILGIPGGNMVDFDPAGLGSCLVYGLTYTGDLNIMMGDDLLAAGLEISTGCFSLSGNNLTVNRIESQTPTSRLFFSSNTTGTIGVLNNGSMGMFASQGMDADGIFYDASKDVLYQINRTDNVVNIYSGVNNAINTGTEPTLEATSTSNFGNGREIAVYANKLVVADDASMANNSTNSLVVYTLGANNTITFDKKHEVNFPVWGIHLEGTTLYAIQDQSPNVSIFNDFFDNDDGSISPDQTIYVQNLIRTHGLTYDSNNDMMILTDIGAAGSADDGYLIIVPEFSTKIGDNALTESEYIRVGGASSMLGNPVDVAYDADNEKIYVAERAVNGGMILGFDMPMTSGNIAPEYVKEFAGASAIYLSMPNNGDCNLIDGGLVELEAGGTSTTIFIDGQPDMIAFTSSVPASADYSFTYVVTDAMGSILGIPGGNMVDFDPAGLGSCLVYGLTYTGDLNIMMGDDLLAAGLEISTDCYDLSGNFLTINRIESQTPTSRLFFSSNTSGTIGVLDNGSMGMFASQGMDADGIFYDDNKDVLYQINRTDNVVNIYTGVNDAIANGTEPTLAATSTSNFGNGREIAVSGSQLVVADDASAANNSTNSLVVYTLGDNNTITYEKKHEVNFPVWGIHLDGNTLYAIQDQSPNVSVFNDFSDNPDGAISPDQTIYVQDLVRTHGLTYDSDNDLMILTDIGEAGSADDGYLIVVPDFSTKIGDNAITESEYIRVGGASSMLGNPVDVAYDADNEKIYVAERAVNGGMILGFDMPTSSGNISPEYTKAFEGASAIFLSAPAMNLDGNTAQNFSNQGTILTAMEQVTVGKLFPVPATTELNIILKTNVELNSTVSVFHVDGTLVDYQEVSLVKGKNQVRLNIGDYPAGYLFLKIPELDKAIPFVKLKE